MPINYPQKWLKEHKVEISTVGWFRPVTYEILKRQKYIRGGDPVNVDKVYIIAPDNVNVNENVRISVKLLPRVATETDYDLTISDETICTLDKITNTLVFKDKPGKVTITVIMKEGGATNTKDINVRLAWDLLRAAIGTAGICEYYDKYSCHDNHIQTLAIKVCKDLNYI